EKIVRQGKKTLDAFKPIGLEEEKAIGASLAMEVFKRFGGPYEDPRLLRYVNMVGQAVARVSDRPNIDYHFAILDSEAPNGFATPGGYVFVSIGLLRMLKNEAELAGALGHEIAHITHKHALKTIQRSKELHGVNALTMTVMEKDPSKFNKLIDEVSNVIFTHGLDKNLEYEADKMGMEYAARVGYQPNGLNEFIRVLGSSPAGKTSIFFSTHPAPRDRVSRLRKLLSAKRRANASPVLANRFETEVKERL
ncbi:MAG: M48 family metalloprotease, partial [Nitrospinales bacterium]